MLLGNTRRLFPSLEQGIFVKICLCVSVYKYGGYPLLNWSNTRISHVWFISRYFSTYTIIFEVSTYFCVLSITHLIRMRIAISFCSTGNPRFIWHCFKSTSMWIELFYFNLRPISVRLHKKDSAWATILYLTIISILYLNETKNGETQN